MKTAIKGHIEHKPARWTKTQLYISFGIVFGLSLSFENSQFFSKKFQEYINSLADTLSERYDLHQKKIIEIGSGKGDFLKLLCNLGENNGFGFDPSFTPDPADQKEKGKIVFIPDYYSTRHSDTQADLICCRHVLEHIPDPIHFLKTIRQAVSPQSNPGIYFEVPNMSWILREKVICDIIYEHCSYFSKESLTYALSRAGFDISEIQEAFDGQFLSLNGHCGKEVEPTSGETKMIEKDVFVFGKDYLERLEQWRAQMRKMSEAGKKVVVWSAGSKGITFLNLTVREGSVEYVIDINPRKQSMFIAGTGQQIVPPDFLKDYQPDIVLVMNSIYKREIEKMMSQLGVKSELICIN